MAEQAHKKAKPEAESKIALADEQAGPGLASGYQGLYQNAALTGAATDKDKWQSFINQCTLANSYLNQCYAAGEVFVRKCSTSYKAGYDAHKAALDRQKASDKLKNDLILGVIFAAVGGAAGGAVGGMVGNYLAAIAKRAKEAGAKEMGKIASGAITDALKDFAKYGTRMSSVAIKSDMEGNTSETYQASTAPPPGVAAVVDPFTWHNSALLTLAQEKVAVFAILTGMHERANKALNDHEAYTANFDPFQLAKDTCTVAGMPLADLANLVVPTADQYERDFWKAWLGQYGYRVKGMGIGHYAEDNVGKDLRKEIDQVAARLGEDGPQFIQQYSAPAKAKAEGEAKKLNTEVSDKVGNFELKGP